MAKYYFTGDIRYPGVVCVLATSEEEARAKLADDEFEVYDKQNKCLAFDDCGEDPVAEE